MPLRWFGGMARFISLKTFTARMLRSNDFWRNATPVRRGSLPIAHAAYIHMNEIGVWIISNSPASQRQGAFPDSGGFQSRQTNVDSLTLHVQTVLGNAGGMR